jgi:hypothetical protein
MSYAKKIKKLFSQSNVTVNNKVNDRIIQSSLKALAESDKTKSILIPNKTNTWMRIWMSRAGYIAAMFLMIAFAGTSFVLSKKVAGLKEELDQARHDLAAVPTDDSTTINFYLKEHEDFIARQASLNSISSQPVPIHVNQSDIMYYEFFDEQPENMNPGIIVKGPSYPGQINTKQTPAISNGHTLTLSEARETADFDLSAPPRLFPGYSLDQIRRIENRDAMHLLYTNGIYSISLFEQPLEGQRKLGPQDFREYAVFQNQGQSGGTILAWRDDTLSYVLIGNVEMSQLIDMAQYISAAK